MDNSSNFKDLLKENEELKKQINDLQDKLKSKKNYNSDYAKKYREEHREHINQLKYKYIDRIKLEQPEHLKQIRQKANKKYYEQNKMKNKLEHNTIEKID